MNLPCTVLLPIHNGGRYVDVAIRRSLEIMDASDKLLIVDDGSDDSALEYLDSRLLSDARITILRTQHVGLVRALNLGISQAKTELIARVDVDDSYEDSRLRLQKEFLTRNHNVGAVFCDYYMTNETGKIIGFIPTAINP